MKAMLPLSLLVLGVILMTVTCCVAQPGAGPYWNAPDRAAKVAAIIPGRTVPRYDLQTLYADFTKDQVARWSKEHPNEDAEAAYQRYAAASPTDAELTADFPTHIAPYAQPHGGQTDNAPEHHITQRADQVLVSYCPFCGSQSFGLQFDAARPYQHAVTTCCHTDLYAKADDYPAGSPLRPNSSVKFLHLDDTWVEVPCTVYKDKDGAEWDLFIGTLFAHKRWIDQDCNLVRQYMVKFEETADPLYVHKLAIILDKVADTYYGLPLGANNKLCMGRDGKGLTRAEWEAVPKPAIFENSYLGSWSKREPYSSPGWLNMLKEHLWVEPFGRVRLHPAFKQVSQKLYGDPDALDQKIRQKLMRELSLMFQSVFSQKLLHNYQEAIYIDLWLLGILSETPVLVDFAAPCQEASMYNHTYQDGMNGEGAPNYQAMPGGYYYPVLKDPQGWLQYQPKFLDENPFYWAASGELYKSQTVRGLSLEWGDQHEQVYASNWISDPAVVRENEKLGSRNWPGYGVGMLRVGGPGHRQEVALGYTRAALHNAQDAMSMECWVDGVPVMRKGGYASWWASAHLQWDRPEFQALRKMAYPHEIAEADYSSFDSWSWCWAHSAQNQNTLTVDEVGTGKGWGDNRGYGECLTYKGGEAAGTPGSGFQVLDVLDHYSWSRVEKDVKDWRRTAIAVEGPDGRPYVVDVTHLVGGTRHALYNQAWADRTAAELPAATGSAQDLSGVFFGGKLPEDTPEYRNFTKVTKIERSKPAAPEYGVTWQQDYGAWASRPADGKPYVRPVPEDVGKVQLRFIGVNQGDQRTELLSGKGPWIGWLRQPLPNGQQVNGNVSFVDARDFLIEYRTGGTAQKPLESSFVHLLEGYRAGEQSAIKSVESLQATSLKGPERRIVALKLTMAAGHTDTVIFQSDAGTAKLPDGTVTDARYALVRRNAKGEVLAADAVRGTILKDGKFSATMPGDFTGTLVDVRGDLTGDRRQSSLFIKPDKPWPAGTNLEGRQLNIRVTSALRDACDEGYRIARTEVQPDGIVRVDLQDYAPFVVSWHQVTELPADKPNTLRTWRPMVDHGNGPWYRGLKLWFPERNKLYTIKTTNEVGGGYGGDRAELVENVNLAAEGIKPGDWYVIYAVQPGLKVRVANDFAWRREPATGWQQYSLRATGPVTVSDPALAKGGDVRTGASAWKSLQAGAELQVALTDAGSAQVIVGKPADLNLNDNEAPALVSVVVEGKTLPNEVKQDLGTVEAPRQASVTLRDAGNHLDGKSLQVTLDGQRIDDPAAGLTQLAFSPDRQQVTVSVNLQQATAADRHQIRRHTLEVRVLDQAVERHEARLSLSYITKAPLDPGAVYLSDLTPLKSFAHGGPNIDRDYGGDVAVIGDRIYPKCLMVCPEPSPDGPHGEMVFALPANAPRTLLSDIGIEETAQTNGSVVFMVQRSNSADGPWETLFTSPILRGGVEAQTIKVELGAAKYLRLYTTDAGDGINSDHALWGNVRLK